MLTFWCQVGRYRYARLLFSAALAGDVLEGKIYGIFKELPNLYGISEDILIWGYDAESRDHPLQIKSYTHS